jgi:toxin-antitoxin system, antitoxin component, xre family
MTKKNCQNRIRVVLADKQITNRWLADQMGVTDMTVSRWKTNKIQPSMAQFVEIARLLQVDIKDLLEVDFNKNEVVFNK